MKTKITSLRPCRPPQTATEAQEFIAQMRRETKSKSARIKMAQMGIKFGNYTPEARDIWAAYLAEESK
jgi:hypothetical protein